ncbi:hypothetical protein [Rhizobium leguminosarum]
MSYSTAVDGQLAPKLQNAIERFTAPWYRPRSLRIFRDSTNLSVSPDLWQAIESSIADVRFFILLASPAAAQSKWEVQSWLNYHGSSRFLIVLTSGTIARDDVCNDVDWSKTDALPKELAQAFSREPLYADLRWANEPERDLSLNNPMFAQAVLSAKTYSPLATMEKDASGRRSNHS